MVIAENTIKAKPPMKPRSYQLSKLFVDVFRGARERHGISSRTAEQKIIYHYLDHVFSSPQ